MSKKIGTLKKAFTAAVLAAAAGIGFVPAQASANAATTTTMLLLMEAEKDRALKTAIVAPTEQNLALLRDKKYIQPSRLPYVHDALKEMNLPKGMSLHDVTDEHRTVFEKLLLTHEHVTIMSSPTVEAALGKGLEAPLAPYFNQCRSTAPANRAEAEAMYQCMEDAHWKNDTLPNIGIIGLTLTVAAGACAVAWPRSRRYS